MSTSHEVKNPTAPSDSTGRICGLLCWGCGSAVVLFLCAAGRHWLFQSGGDLAHFDQAVYLISRGLPAKSSIIGYHILGDHAAWVLYPLALLYRAVPSPYCLLLVQAIALAIAVWPLQALARDAGVPAERASVLTGAYLLYPVVFNANLFDFHPEVIAVPILLATALAARRRQWLWYCLGIAATLSCKQALALSIAGLGCWLFLFEERRAYGAVAVGTGVAWAVLTMEFVIPSYSAGHNMVHATLFGSFGTSPGEIVINVACKPWLVIARVFSVSSLGYIAGLVAPVVWGLRKRHLAPLIGAAPVLAVNLLSDSRLQRHLTNQYSLPLVPFLLLAVLSTLAADAVWIRNRRVVLAWCAVGFLIFARYPRLVQYLQSANTVAAKREAVRRIPADRGVAADRCLVPHVTHRQTVYEIEAPHEPAAIEYVLENLRDPCTPAASTAALIDTLGGVESFVVVYEANGVRLLRREPLRK